jgi:predicted ATPase
VLLIVTFRPEFQAPWIGRHYVTSLTINRLGERDIRAMIDRIAGNRFLPANLRQDIIERTDGIPLFVEEMTKAVLEAGSEDAAQRTAAAIPSAALAVPASLQASLMARLDRLGSAKEVAQIGAAIGREFSHALLSAVVTKPGLELAPALDQLVSAGLLFRQGVPPHASYLFKHALVQDAAYSTLLREPRRALHAQIVDVIESQFPAIAENQPELLARHCTEAGLIEKAAKLWGTAGQRSLDRSALVEAAEQLTRALGQIADLAVTPILRQQEIQLQVALITPLIHLKGYAAPETKAAAQRARLLIEQAKALGEAPEDHLLLFSALYGFWIASYVKFDGNMMLSNATEFLAMAEKQRATVPVMVGHRLMGISLFCTGDIQQGWGHFDRASASYDPAKHRALGTRFGVDTGVSIFAYRSQALWVLGHSDAALADAHNALKYAREINHAATLMYALHNTSLAQIFCGNYEAADAQLNEVVSLAEQKGALYWKANGVLVRGWISALTSKASDAIQMLTSGLAAYRSTGSTNWVPLHLSYLAKAYSELNQFDKAWHHIGEAVRTVETTQERWCEAEVYRMAGEIALLSSELDAAKAEGHFQRALAGARRQQAKSWELRAAMSLARLWRDQGRVQQARDLLAPVYGWFTEGFDTRDLKEAKALLDTLGA